MFIKKIIIDGFKSYGKKVEITGFDDSFNAITGFNGSGKSNILDAICFVLGLSKLELARCHLLSDLIYKNGHAGVTTASVTIEIDNSNNIFHQLEFKDSSTIIVRREINVKNQSKFFINGFAVTKEKLLDFFQSVSLNIQNPHFLIMQGKIVKVVSMKPIEILSMVEEAVGLSVYENKKKHNLLKIEKCDVYLNEIDSIIEEIIRPKLNQLKEEEKSLNVYRNVCTEYERMAKISIAHKFLKDEAIVNTTDSNIQSNTSIIKSKQAENCQLKNESEKLSKQIMTLQKRFDEEKGGDLKQLESSVNEKRQNLERITTNKKLAIDNLNETQTELNKIKQKCEKDNKKFETKKKEYEKKKELLDRLKEENDSNEQILRKAQEDFEAVTLGLSKGLQGEEAATCTQQLLQSKDLLAEIEAKINKSKLVIQHIQKDLNNKKEKVKSDKDVYDRSVREIQLKTKEIDSLLEELQTMGFNEEIFEDVKKNLNQLRKDSRSLDDKLHQLQSTVPLAKFKCSFADIDERNILGVVCDLFTVKKPEYELAIEKTCGNRFYSVVVTDADVAASIIRKNLKERRTFLPLDRINGRDVDLKALRIAERLVGKGNVSYAINLVDFDPKLRNAMKYVFGDVMVCPNMSMAKKVAFAEGVMKRTVTYDGEIFDPSGTLTGGALRSGPKILETVKEIRMVLESLHEHRISMGQLEEDFQRMLQLSKKYYDKKSKCNLKQKEIELLNQRLAESSHGLLIKDIEDLEKTVQEEERNITNFVEDKNSMLKQIKELEYKIKDAEKTKEKEREEAKQSLESAKKKFDMSSKQFQKEEQNFQCLSQEFKHHEDTVQNWTNQVKKLQEDLEKIQKEIETLDENIETIQEEFNIAMERYNNYKAELNAKSKEITDLQKQLEQMKNTIDENELEIKKKEFEIENIYSSLKEAKERLHSLIHKHSWIKEEKKFFHSSDSEYGVLHQNFNEEEFYSIMKTLKSKKEQLSKTVNLRANIMQGEKQKEFEELLTKRDNTVKDRRRLMKYIEEVEKKKDKELRDAWKKINANFGSIFSTLLPNANAKLTPINENSMQEGFQIKVSFGEVWKESLSELSGGQRSLVALSLVLALLKYNPAPLYILDEIDAALDQSHTQNIGIMIKKHFKNAQFIIVSLKDDMFSNANVLFQTKFIDGYSSVERIKRN